MIIIFRTVTNIYFGYIIRNYRVRRQLQSFNNSMFVTKMTNPIVRVTFVIMHKLFPATFAGGKANRAHDVRSSFSFSSFSLVSSPVSLSRTEHTSFTKIQLVQLVLPVMINTRQCRCNGLKTMAARNVHHCMSCKSPGDPPSIGHLQTLMSSQGQDRVIAKGEKRVSQPAG
jgi:hypothetical protein